MHFKGDTKGRYAILMLVSLYGMGDASAFVIKGDAHAFGMGDAPAFVIKGDTPLVTRVSFTYIIGDMQSECTSPFCQ
jgi:hypothetical protein